MHFLGEEAWERLLPAVCPALAALPVSARLRGHGRDGEVFRHYGNIPQQVPKTTPQRRLVRYFFWHLIIKRKYKTNKHPKTMAGGYLTP